MVQFFVKRVIGLLFILLGVTFITFMMGYLAPGDPIRTQMGSHFDYDAWVRLRQHYGLDLPWYQQYYNYLARLLRLDLGVSFQYKDRLVWDMLKDALPISLELGFWGLLLTLLLGIPTGIIAAIRANTWFDTSSMAMALIFYALPTFVFCVLAQVLIGWLNGMTGFRWPISNWGETWQYSLTDIQFKLAPILVYGAAGYAYFARLGRTTMLEVLRQDYVRTARAKGLTEKIVVYRHALHNAMIPLITVIGIYLGFMITGSFFIERIFNIRGIAQVSVNAVFALDYPIIQAVALMIALCVVIGNLISDILYTVTDPRIKLS